MFRTCPLVVINEIDLLPHVDFSIDRFLANLDQVNPDAETLQVSARTGRGIEAGGVDGDRAGEPRLAAR